jgi:hypothetical protein
VTLPQATCHPEPQHKTTAHSIDNLSAQARELLRCRLEKTRHFLDPVILTESE